MRAYTRAYTRESEPNEELQSKILSSPFSFVTFSFVTRFYRCHRPSLAFCYSLDPSRSRYAPATSRPMVCWISNHRIDPRFTAPLCLTLPLPISLSSVLSIIFYATFTMITGFIVMSLFIGMPYPVSTAQR